ncbi:hypothetical protein Aduo_005102 [Ancylostoma duodenale]
MVGVARSRQRPLPNPRPYTHSMVRTLDFRTELNGNILTPEILSKQAWISQRDEKFPIKLRLILKQKSVVERIQIVAHSKFIPQEVMISTAENEHTPTEKVMGAVDFKVDSDGQNELKTIYTNVDCTAIILGIQKAHANDILNPFRQVGLVEVKIYGRYDSNGEQHALFPQNGASESVDIEDEGRFTAEIDELLQRVEKNKRKSAANENFGLASQAQFGSLLLQKARGEIAELESEQRSAIEDEDFHRALDLQEEIKTLRGNNIDTKSDNISIHRPKNLFEKNGSNYEIPAPKLFTPIDLSPTDDLNKLKPLPAPPRAPSPANSTTSKASSTRKITRKPSSPNVLHRSGSASTIGSYNKPPSIKRPTSASSKASKQSQLETITKRSNSPVPSLNRWHGNKFLEKENTVVPALKARRRRESESMQEEYRDVISVDAPLPPIPLMEKATYSRGVELFGEETMRKLYSKKWEERKDGLASVQHVLETAPTTQAQAADYLDCAMSILQRHLKDPLYNTYTRALELLSYICTQFLPQYSLYRMANSIVKSTAKIIAMRASDTDRRSAGITLSTINDIMEQDNKIAKPYLSRFLKMGAPGGQRGQAAIIQNAVETLGAPNVDAYVPVFENYQ